MTVVELNNIGAGTRTIGKAAKGVTFDADTWLD